MKPSRFTLLLLFCVQFSIPIAAQQSPDGSMAGGAHRKAQHDARALFAAGDLAAGERLLAGLHRAPVNTARWHERLARQLTLMAHEMVAAGQHASTPSVVSRALQHYARAAQLTENSVARAAAHYASGEIYERFVGDRTAAKKSYLAAIDADPRHRGAVRKLARLDAADEIQGKKFGRRN